MTIRPGTRSSYSSSSLDKWTAVWGTVTYAMLAISFGVSMADGTLAWPMKIAAAGGSVL